MFRVVLSTFCQKSKVHHIQIKQAALQIDMPKKPRKYRDRYKTVNVDGSTIWLTYQWQDDQDEITIMFVESAKFLKKKRKR